ncbi:MAG: SDR family NAD(P)-dependent oxidoreductase [Terriglobales bacterium]
MSTAPAPGPRRGYALVTGASRGIGAAFAEALAARGYPLILTARSGPDLEALAARLRRPELAVEVVTADLAGDGAAALLRRIGERGWEVELLVNNAGLGSISPFTASVWEREREQIEVNTRALVELAHGLAPAMQQRRSGAIINLASVAASQPVPCMAGYAASKAFVVSFSLALYGELRPAGVHVMALCPGPTRTHFFEAAGVHVNAPMQSPEFVVRCALRGLDRRRAVVVCGFGNRVLARASAMMPRVLLVRVLGRLIAARYPRLK